MQKKLSVILSFVSLLALGFSLSAQAAETSPERIRHYEVAAPKTYQAALAQLDADIQKIQKIIDKADLQDAELEAIHEISYSMEESLETLERASEKHTAFPLLKEAVEEMHLASEEREEVKTRHAFEQIKALKMDMASSQ